jgi:hypothetical protein
VRRHLIAAAAATSVLVTTLLGGLPARADGPVLIRVATEGDDDGGRTDAAENPLRSIGRAVRLAQPGDRIVVAGGTYTGAAGYGATPGTEDAPIRLVAAKGERVVLRGTLQLENADHWVVDRINVTADPDGPRREFLVKFDGGTGWRFTNAEVWGSRGVSNVMISGSAKNGTPKDYRLTGNCIHDNDATDDPFMNDHLIYLMPGYRSTGGLIEHNTFFNAENGAAVKAAGPDSSTGAGDVAILRNTVVRTAAGVVVGHGSNGVTVKRNLIGDQRVKAPSGARWVANYRAAVVGNHVTGDGNVVARNAVWDFDRTVFATADSRDLSTVRNVKATPSFSGTGSCGAFQPRNEVARTYGRAS